MKTIFRRIDETVQGVIREATFGIILPAFNAQVADNLICVKNDHSIVTKTDFDVQHFIQGRLQSLLPESGFFGEEDADYKHSPHSEWVWILDPIDGTHNFAYQNEDFGTMLALWHAPTQQPVCGWIYLSVADVMFSGGAGEGVTCNRRDIVPGIEKTPDRMTGLLNYNSFAGAEAAMSHNGRIFREESPSSCAALKFAALLDGSADFAAFGRAKIWDLSAGFALLQELGGYAACINRPCKELSLLNRALGGERYLAARHQPSWDIIHRHLFENITF